MTGKSLYDIAYRYVCVPLVGFRFTQAEQSEPGSISRSSESAIFQAASAWEIGVKHALGRLPLPGKPETYIPQIRKKSGIEALPVDEHSALYTARLPKIHTDPFDRILVAQATLHGMVILTPDDAIAQYAVRVLW